MIGKCWNCNQPLEGGAMYARSEECPQCHKDTHVCRNCNFYDPQANHQCREPQADLVVEKEKSNFCDYFQPSSKEGGAGQSKDQLRAAAEALFGKKK